MKTLKNKTYYYRLNRCFKFNSAHFIAFDNFRETLHGHNYKIGFELSCDNISNKYNNLVNEDIIDKELTFISKYLKHKILIAENCKYIKIIYLDNNKDILHETINYEKENKYYYVKVIALCDNKEFIFPASDVLVLKDINQISVECLCKYVCDVLYENKDNYLYNDVKYNYLSIKIYEDIGKAGVYKKLLN